MFGNFDDFNIKSHQETKRFPHGGRHFQKIYGALTAALNVLEHLHLFTKNLGRNWGIFDSNDFLKLWTLHA